MPTLTVMSPKSSIAIATSSVVRYYRNISIIR